MRASVRVTVGLLVGSGLLATSASAQRPDFSGDWVLVVDSGATRSTVAATGDAAFRRGDMGSGWGSALTIRQLQDSLIIESPHFSTYDLQPRLRFVFALDGQDSRNTVMIGHASSEQRSRASWSDNALLITTSFPAPAGSTMVRQVLSLGVDGTLSIETTREGAAPVRTSYRKR
jgi:hypothetical protein